MIHQSSRGDALLQQELMPGRLPRVSLKPLNMVKLLLQKAPAQRCHTSSSINCRSISSTAYILILYIFSLYLTVKYTSQQHHYFTTYFISSTRTTKYVSLVSNNVSYVSPVLTIPIIQHQQLPLPRLASAPVKHLLLSSIYSLTS